MLHQAKPLCYICIENCEYRLHNYINNECVHLDYVNNDYVNKECVSLTLIDYLVIDVVVLLLQLSNLLALFYSKGCPPGIVLLSITTQHSVGLLCFHFYNT